MARWRWMAVLMATGLITGCGSPGSVTSSPDAGPPGGTVPDCGASTPVRDRPVFAVAISARGQVCWEAALTNPQADSHSSDQPLIADGAAVLGADGQVITIDLASGQIRWRWNSGVPGYAGFGLGDGRVGYGSDRVLATRGSGASEDIVGLDQSSGAVRWTHPAADRGNGSTIDLMDGGLALTYGGLITSVLNDGDGSTRWASRGLAPSPSSTETTQAPVSHPGAVTSIPPAEPSSGLMEPTGGPLVAGGQIIEETQGAVTTAVAASTGKQSWHRPSGSLAQLATAGGLLLLTTTHDSGGSYPTPATTVAVDPSSGATRWTMATAQNTRFTSVDGMLLVEEPDTLIRVDPRTGRQVWRAAANFGGTAVVDDGRIIEPEAAGSESDALMLVGRDPSTGKVDWQTPFPTSGVEATVYATNGSAVVVDGDRVLGYDPGSGARDWTVNLPDDTELDGSAGTPGGVVVQAFNQSVAIEGH